MNKTYKKTDLGQNLRWTEAEKKPLCTTSVFTVHTQASFSPENRKKEFITVDAPDWVITVPVLEKKAGINEQCFLLVKQWRHGAKELSAEFPGGVVDKNESPEEAARRELLEETGFTAQTWSLLGTMNPNPALFCNKVYFFAAKKLINTHAAQPDEDEFLQVSIVPVKEVYKKMGQMPYIHALMASALCLYRQYNEE